MSLKKCVSLLMVTALCVLSFAGCSAGSNGKSDSKVSSAAQNGGTIGVLVVTTQSQWCNDIISSVTDVAKSNGWKVIVSDSQVSADNELSGMENLINSGCKAIVVNAMNPAALADLCATAQKKGIYIIGWSKLLAHYNALVVDDYAKESQMITSSIKDYVTEKKLGSCDMAEIWMADAANPDTTTGVFKTALEKEFKSTLFDGMGIHMVNSQYASDSNAAMNKAEAILAANPKVKVIFCQNDEMGTSVAQAIQAKGIDVNNIMVCGLDGSDQAIKSIASGTSCMRATIYVDTKAIGKSIGESIINNAKTGKASDVVPSYVLVDSSNASQYVSSK